MNTEIIGVIAMFIASVALAIPLGRYIGKVYNGEKTWLDFLFNPIDKLFFKLGGVKPEKEMSWQQNLVALLLINVVWFVLVNVCTDEHELASAEPGRQPFHECRPCI